MEDIRWEDPPDPRGGPGRAQEWVRRLEPLMAHPKRWAIIAEPATAATAGAIRGNLAGGRNQVPPGRWEFTARSTPPRVYARYLGPDENGAS